MSMSSPSPPQAADPTQVANQQQQYNMTDATAAQAASNINQVTPFGSLSYNQSGTGPGGVPLYTATTQLSPDQQSILDTLQKQSINSLNQGNYGAQNPSDVIGNSTSGLTKDLLDKEVSYLHPFFTTQTQEKDTQLRNQGLLPSATADPSNPSSWGPYERAMNQIQQGQNQSVSGFLASAEPAAYQQSVSNYMMPLSVTAAEMGLMRPNAVTGSLATTNPLSLQPPNYVGAVANAQDMQMKAYQAQLQKSQAAMSGLFGIPTAALGGWAKGGFPGASSIGSMFGGGEAAGAAGGAALDGSLAAGGADLAALAFI